MLTGCGSWMSCRLEGLIRATVCIGLASTTSDLRLLSLMSVYFRVVRASTGFYIGETTYCSRLHAFGNTISVHEDECQTRAEGGSARRRLSLKGKIWREKWQGAYWVRVLQDWSLGRDGEPGLLLF
jgi:hypothetical protein